MPFFNKLIQTLKPGATIELRTNLEWYAQEAISQSNNSNNKKERSNLLLVKYEKFSNPKNDSTHFEKKYLLTGQLCYQLIFMKPKKDQIT
jgi:tRNA G46 methylase TrmB